MPRRRDIESICLIGSGPIVIGQACEFDYAGCQALKVLREDGFRTIVVNSNPATIMTDPGFADRTYLEPLDLEGVAGVLERERPDALLPTMGGQTALNLAVELAEEGILDDLGVELIGAPIDVIRRAEDRERFRDTVLATGLRVPESTIVTSLGRRAGGPVPAGDPAARRSRSAATAAGRPGRPRSSSACSSVRSRESPVGQVLVEESLIGWDEFELELMRDSHDNAVVVCSIENLDPMGDPHRRLGDRRAADDALRRGLPGAPRRGDRRHPRGRGRLRRLEHPVRARARDRRAARDRDEPARLALLRARLEGDRLSDRQGRREARRRLHARRDPERPDRDDARQLRADARLRRRQVPALRLREVPRRRHDARHADEVGRRGDGHRAHVQRGVPEGAAAPASSTRRATPWARSTCPTACIPGSAPRSRASRRAGRPSSTISSRTTGSGSSASGSPTRRSPSAAGRPRRSRARSGAAGASGRRTGASTPAPPRSRPPRTTTTPPGARPTRRRPTASKPRVVILGSGPNRIGQGIEFDYCCVHAAKAFRALGFEAVMVNCNPETVSTDYDTSDRLYFEPLGAEEVLEICARELPDGVVIQFGGQTPLKLAREIEAEGWRILGTPFDAVDLAEDRERFAALCDELDIARALLGDGRGRRRGGRTSRRRSAIRCSCAPPTCSAAANMQVCYDDEAVARGGERPAGACSSTSFLEGAIEIDVDALCDGQETYVAAVMEHVEEAGIHSGDSSCVLPAPSLDAGDARPRSSEIVRRLAPGARRGRPRQRPARGRRTARSSSSRRTRARRGPCPSRARRPASTSSRPPAGSPRARRSPSSTSRPSPTPKQVSA